ncbi:MAG: PEP-CTERM sorting domain-containing protein [Candidatus Korobacteraceae bacterium]
MRLKTLLVIVALAVCVTAAPAIFAQNLVTNGSFETGDFTGWTTGGNFEDTEVISGAFYDYTGAQDGNFYTVMGPVGSDGTLSQTLATTAGAQYTVSFWFGSVGDNPSDFSASWDGTQLLSLTNPNTGSAWTQYTYQVTGTGSDTLTFAFRDDPAYMALDNVSVTENSGQSVPEPSSLLLLGTGVLGLGGVVRRKLGR